MIIYVITNSTSGKRYVGKTTKTLAERWMGHVGVAPRSDVPLARAIRKYGPDDFTMEVLEECCTLDELNAREIYWIAELDTYAGRGYNATPGGDGNSFKFGPENHNYGKRFGFSLTGWTEEAKLKFSKDRQGTGNPMFGRSHTSEARQKISKTQHKPVNQLNEKGEVLATYASVQEAAKAVDAKASGISRVCRGGRNRCRGFGWEYTDPHNRA